MARASGTFKHKAGKNEVEFIRKDDYIVVYIHVHHVKYGDFEHVIIRGMHEQNARTVAKYWNGDRTLFIEWEFVSQVEATADSSAHTVGDYVGHILQ
jgi:hypothetical protein